MFVKYIRKYVMDLINIHYKEEEKGEADGSLENSHDYHIPHKIITIVRVTIIVLIEYYCVLNKYYYWPGIMPNILYICSNSFNSNTNHVRLVILFPLYK